MGVYKGTKVDTLVLRSASDDPCHVYVGSTGTLSTGDLQGFPNGQFIIEVAPEIASDGLFHESLKRVVRNALSAYPIAAIEDGGGLPFDFKAWLRER